MDTINSNRELWDLWGVEIIEKQARRKKRMSGEQALDEPLTRKDVKSKLLEALDTLKEENASRSERLKKVTFQFYIFLRPSELIKASQYEVKEVSRSLSDKYQNFDGAELVREMDDLKCVVRQKEVSSSATDLLMLMGKYGEAFANMKVAIKLLITIGSSITGCEGSWSELQLSKTYLRSTMRQDRLTNLALLSMTSWREWISSNW